MALGDSEQTRRCPRCQTWKALVEFSGNRCKPCHAASERARRRGLPTHAVTKACKACGVEKPLKLFGRAMCSEDGRQPTCKECMVSAQASGADVLRACTRCGLEQPLSSFGKRKGGEDGRQWQCNPCIAAKTRQTRAANPELYRALDKAQRQRRPEATRATYVKCGRVTRWHSTLVCVTKQTARKHGYAFDIDADFILALLERQNGRCHWLGVPLVPSTVPRDPQRPSIDRIDPDRGYTKDNVVLACQFANMGRSSSSRERTVEFIELLKQTIRSC